MRTTDLTTTGTEQYGEAEQKRHYARRRTRRTRGLQLHAHARRVGGARARVEAGVLRPRRRHGQARRHPAAPRGPPWRLAGAHVGRRRAPLQPPLGALLHAQLALHRERLALHRYLNTLAATLCAHAESVLIHTLL